MSGKRAPTSNIDRQGMAAYTNHSAESPHVAIRAANEKAKASDRNSLPCGKEKARLSCISL
jgi:hypothetical protein